MAGVDDPIRQAVAALKAGRKAEARALLEGIVEQDQRHEQAWFYLSAAVETLEEQEICLENVLAINPQNAKAQQGLASLRQKKQQPPSGPVAGTSPLPPPAATGPSGRSSGRASPPRRAEYEPFSNSLDAEPPVSDTSSFDWFGGMSQPAGGDELPDSDPYAVPTSVDWGHSDGPAAHGSGRDVEMPSAQEWDAWVQRLNINQNSADTPAPAQMDAGQDPFVLDDNDPFGEAPYSADDDRPYVEDRSAAQADESFGEPSSWFTAFGDEEPAFEEAGTDEDPFSSANGFDAPIAPRSFGASSPIAAEPVEDDFSFDAGESELAGEEEDFDFSFDDDEDIDANAPSVRPGQSAKPASAKADAAPLPGAEYYRLIPGEIEASAGGVGSRGLLMLGGIVVLLILNLISFAALLL